MAKKREFKEGDVVCLKNDEARTLMLVNEVGRTKMMNTGWSHSPAQKDMNWITCVWFENHQCHSHTFHKNLLNLLDHAE